MHIWCKTEKLLDMYLYLVSVSGLTRGRDWSPMTGRAGPEMDSRYGQCHILNTRLSGTGGMKNIFLDDHD